MTGNLGRIERIRVGGASLNQTPLDWRGNRERIIEAIRLAREAEVQVLCLPELCVSGYGCEDAFHSEWVAEEAAGNLELIAAHTQGIAAAVGLPVLFNDALFNCAAVLSEGRLHGIAAKQLLAGSGVHYEPRWFKAWPAGTVSTTRIGHWEVPIGDLVFDLGGITAAFEICEDAWGRSYRGPRGSARWADLLLNPSASHFSFGKHEVRRGIVLEGSRDTHAVYLYSNLLGNESGRIIYDGTVLIASDGRMVAESPRFSFRDVVLQSAIVDIRANRLERRRLNYPLPPEGWLTQHGVKVPLRLKEPSLEAQRAERAQRGIQSEPPHSVHAEPGRLSRYREFAHAVTLGLWDYMRKSRSAGLLISLSGGVDSATCAVMGWLMCKLALAELGWKGVRAKMFYLPELDNPDRIVERLLCTLYQGTGNSSSATRQAAAGLARQLGARHLEWRIDPLVKEYEQLAEQALGIELSWEEHDTSRQNIQARARSPGIWLLANLENRLLVSTSNRSEIGVGYCTMDGDTSGGVAPIAGANKTFLRGWLRWMETDGIPGLGALPALGPINDQSPTAELRPLGSGQTDEADLMPYPVLDAIEQAAIRDRMSPLQVWRHLLSTPLPGGPPLPEAAARHVERFFQLWGRSQWKRERLAPAFHLDDENLDPKTWCRFPILSGNYESELEALRREAFPEPPVSGRRSRASSTKGGPA